MSTFRINIHQAIYSLSDSLDLVGVTHIHHGKRVAYIAAECAKRLGWSGNRLDDLFHASILHDCGVSKTSIHSRLIQFEWEGEKDHGVIGGYLLKQSPLLAGLSDMVTHHHTHWTDLEKLPLPPEIKMSANCIYLADRVDVLTLASMKDQSNILLGIEQTRRMILEKRGNWFSPELVDTFMDISRSEAFWFRLESEQVSGYTATWVSHDRYREVDFNELRGLVKIFAIIVDAKSTYTREHSEGVARLARYIGELFHMTERDCEMLELAGLLHDLGKLRVPDEYLEKQDELTPEEYADIKRHSFETFNILKGIHGLEEIAAWAAQHHERADGTGYPFHLQGNNIPWGSQIIAVADVFQALAQNRPYRGALPPDEIIIILKEKAIDGKLNAKIVDVVEAHLHECWTAALAI